ncbi:MAG: MFS transporter [Deltaproteobacteria bacterium]|nr:MFS transporter [Deltaproteobacteria bacterium]
MTEPRRSPFPRLFWTAISFEFFERGAYYGVLSVLAVYLAADPATGGLGFSKDKVGVLTGIFMPVVYAMPILAGALADRFGYRRTLAVAFSLLGLGYFLTSQVHAYPLVLGSLVLLAVGAGTFKPVISGTIARTTDASNSGLGFGIFYWTINLGAFTTPFVVAWLRGLSWSYVFWLSAAMTAGMLLPTFLVYRDPPRPTSTKPLPEVLAGMVAVLKDWRFILMIAIYALFWVLYFQMFHTVLWYLEAFVDRGPLNAAVTSLLAAVGIDHAFEFDVAYVTAINAGSIIALQMIVSRIVNRTRALPTMIAGIGIATCGMALLGLSHSIWIFVAGVALFSVGEMTAHPKFISYVGQIAPRDKVALYMGYAFLYGVIGSSLGNTLGGFLYQRLVDDPAALGRTPRPMLLWWIFTGIGVAAILGLLAYDRWIARGRRDTTA